MFDTSVLKNIRVIVVPIGAGIAQDSSIEEIIGCDEASWFTLTDFFQAHNDEELPESYWTFLVAGDHPRDLVENWTGVNIAGIHCERNFLSVEERLDAIQSLSDGNFQNKNLMLVGCVGTDFHANVLRILKGKKIEMTNEQKEELKAKAKEDIALRLDNHSEGLQDWLIGLAVDNMSVEELLDEVAPGSLSFDPVNQADPHRVYVSQDVCDTLESWFPASDGVIDVDDFRDAVYGHKALFNLLDQVDSFDSFIPTTEES